MNLQEIKERIKPLIHKFRQNTSLFNLFELQIQTKKF